MKFNSSARFNRKAFNTTKSFDAGIHDAGTVTINTVEYPAAFANWQYRKAHYIVNAGAEQTDYQIKLTIYRSAGTDSGDEVYVGTDCEENYVDIRFTTDDGETLCDFYKLESDAASATFWVKVPTLTATGNTLIYMYYGNPDAVYISDEDATYIRYVGYEETNYMDSGHTFSPIGIELHFNIQCGTGFNCAVGSSDLAYSDFYSAILNYEYTNIGVCKDGSVTSQEGLDPIAEGFNDIIIRAIPTTIQFFDDGSQIGTDITTNIPDSDQFLIAMLTGTNAVQYYAFVVKYSANITHGAWAESSKASMHILEFQFTHEKTIEQTPALTYELTPANITATIELTPEVMSSVFIDTTPVWEIPFEDGASEITVGETVTGDTSGASGTVTTVVVESGTWGGGDAAGYILVEDVSGVFEDGEDLDGTLAGDDAVVVASDPYRITPIIIEKSCWKSIDEVYWQASVLLDGLYAYTDVAGFKELYLDMKDHTDTDQRVFYGFIPDQGIVQNPGDNTTRLSAFSHAWFLSNQYIPELYRDTVEWVPVGDTGYVTYLEPSVEIGYLLGGANWNLITGCKPLYINAVADWGSATHPIRGFAFGPDVTKWMAAMEIADYLGWVFDVVYDITTDIQGARFCDVDDIDTYMGIPAAVTFDHDAAAKYVLSVTKEKRGTEYPNRIRVQGRRNKRILNFVNGAVEFTPGNTVVDGGTGAEATIISCTTEGGSWGTPGDLAYGYLIISYDRTADFVNGDTIVDELGGAWGNAVMQGNSALYETYDEYPYTIESADVTGEDVRAREKFFQLEEEYDSTPLIEAKAQEYYDMYCLDPIPVTAVFRDRCDLRLWQKVKFTNFDEITEDWLRIVSIKYTEMAGGDVTITCTLNNSAYVIAQRKMKRSLKNNDVAEIEKIVKTLLAKKDVKPNTVLKVQGEGVTVQLEDGSIVVLGRSPEG